MHVSSCIARNVNLLRNIIVEVLYNAIYNNPNANTINELYLEEI